MSHWLIKLRDGSKKGKRIICFPHAGGSGGVFNTWSEFLPSDVELLAVQMQGRGNRFQEPPSDDINYIVDCIFDEVCSLPPKNFILFGHSLGGIIAYELSKRLDASPNKKPDLLAVSGCRPPQEKRKKRITYDLPNEEFICYLNKLGGIPMSVFQEKELLKLCLPALRADIKIAEKYKGTIAKLNIPIVTFNGNEDYSVPITSAICWSECTSKKYFQHTYEGEHFFLYNHVESIIGNVLQHSTFR